MDPRESRALIDRLNCDAARIAGRFGLRHRAIEAERPNVKSRYGVCYADGRIRIRLRHASTGRSLKYSSLVNTLCHELAHLRHFDHGPRFTAFYLRLLDFAWAVGINQPGPVAAAAAELHGGIAMARASAPRRSSAAGRKDAAAPEQMRLF
jgi:hypothetical protein